MVQAEMFKSAVGNGKQSQRVDNSRKPSQFSVQRAANPNEQRHRSAQVPYADNKSRAAGSAAGAPQLSTQDGRVRLRGRIGRYFDLKRTQSGTPLAVFSLATFGSYRDESGNWHKKTVWQKVVVWGEPAQAVGEQLRQGAQVQVEGKFKTREWTDKEDQLHTTTELVAREVLFLDAAQNGMVA